MDALSQRRGAGLGLCLAWWGAQTPRRLRALQRRAAWYAAAGAACAVGALEPLKPIVETIAATDIAVIVNARMRLGVSQGRPLF
jgi:hypothetical protein